jgi:hypothetical protein
MRLIFYFWASLKDEKQIILASEILCRVIFKLDNNCNWTNRKISSRTTKAQTKYYSS